ncbi:MAG: DUF3368 domain-containing protein [Actinomycetota bacterium]|nr:DUF3368 domain-containing protein [Actinomycetota bacterium]
MKRTSFLIDACIIFDFVAGESLNYLFESYFEFLTTDLIMHDELETPSVSDLADMGLRAIGLDGPTLQSLITYIVRYPAIKRNDAILLGIAVSRKMPLLTGDKALRKAAEGEGVVVHGTLWLLDRLVESGVFDARDASDALEKMVARGRRLPAKECGRLIAGWRKT